MIWLTAAALAGTDEVRLALVVSSNHGLAGEEPLKYADGDAERVAHLLRTLGRYGPGDVWVVPGARVQDVFSTLARVTVRAQEVVNGGGTASLLVFYAGHAGADGLHLSQEVLPLPDLKSAIRVVPAEDRIVVLDACHAGTIARSRGATLIDVRDQPAGFEPPTDEAWLSSSGPEERSFEVEDRRGALFTHFFLSGARGAADTDGDQRVTLGELYDFVRVHTAEAAAGIGQLQQPRWAGDLVAFPLTDLGAIASGVRFVGPVTDPLLVIDDRAEQVVAEIPRGAGASLALDPGSYQVVAVGADTLSVARLEVPQDGWTLWTPADHLTRVPAVRTRGGMYDLTPWALSVGVHLGLGATPGRFDTQAVSVGIERVLGRGHAVLVGVEGGWLPYTRPGWQGSDGLVAARVAWTRELAGRRWVLAPGVAATSGLVVQRSERAPDPVWGRWYGADHDRVRQRQPFAGLEAGLGVDVPTGPIVLTSWAAAGLVVGRTEGLAPAARVRVGFEVPFRGRAGR